MTTVDAILKEVYGPRIESQQQDEVVALKRVERSSDGIIETVGGKYVNFPIKVRRNHGIGYRDESAQLPAADNQKFAEVTVPLRYGYGRVRFTGQLMKLADKNHQAFASAMDEEMDGLKDDVVKDSNRIVYGDQTGAMAAVTADGANTVTVDNIQYLEVGMIIDLINSTNDAVLASNRTITIINEATLVVTYDGADVAATTDHRIVRTGNWKKEPNGFRNIINSSGTLHGLSAATESKWAATVLANGGVNRALSEGLMIQTMDEARRKGGKPSVIFTSLGVRRAYFNLLTQQRRYTDTKEFAGGFTGLAFHYGKEIPVIEDVDAPPNRMFGVMESAVKVYRSEAWHWAADDGNVLKWVHDFDAWEALLRQYWELGTARRNGHTRIDDITEG